MLQLLTKYLFQYKKVSVPHVGTIQLVHNPTVLLLVEKKLEPPSFLAVLQKEEAVSDHQLNFLDAFLNAGKDIVLRELTYFGNTLQEKIEGTGFEWQGLGIISSNMKTLPINITGLETIRAEKIIRQDSQHNILVGDKEMTSVQMTELRSNSIPFTKKASYPMTIGWIVLGVSIITILIVLFLGKFKTNATGSKQSPTGYCYSSNTKFS